ncbi:CHAP domain-containing protein [Bifidobacterium psychraerophilum]|uniref:CHAP domain-containing protein n=1 Tax=Bifidobacterium psychraerophilum TaxID=218140 RepID=UPI0039EB8B59
MKHAAHSTRRTSHAHARTSAITTLGEQGRRSMARRRSQAAEALNAVDAALADKLNEVAPESRRSMRIAAKRNAHKAHLLAGTAMAALVGTAAGSIALAGPRSVNASSTDGGSTTSLVRNVSDSSTSSSDASAASRSQSRVSLNEGVSSSANNGSEGTWALGDSKIDTSQLSRAKADNAVVAKLLDANKDVLPSGFNPDHATGDSGNAYSFSQCTWWVYLRRHQLGLPVGSHFGDGHQWASSAQALGYWVDNTPRNVGDIMVFRTGQEGSSSAYGHVAIVEKINADGSVVTSECGSSYNGKTFSRTFTNVHDFQYIHY